MNIQYKTTVYNMHSDGALTCFSNFLFLMYSSKGVVLLATNKVTYRENRAQLTALKTGRDLDSNYFLYFFKE